MTAALSSQTAQDIIASHGADPARWPGDVRAGLLALAALDDGVAAALVEARKLDEVLADWAAMPAPVASIDVAEILKLPQEGLAPIGPRSVAAWRPALIAASAALVLAVGGWIGWSAQTAAPNAMQVAAVSPSAGASAGETDDGFAYVFTPTAAEEDLI